MTGYGEGRTERDGLSVRVEIRTVNNRHLKLSCRLPDGYAALEPHIESVVRKTLKRGTCYLTLTLERQDEDDEYKINEQRLRSYCTRLKQLSDLLHAEPNLRLDRLLALPGVIETSFRSSDQIEEDWPTVELALNQAIENLTRMRAQEGVAMGNDLLENCRALSANLDRISERAPFIVEAYQQRLRERLNQLLAEFDVQVQAQDVIREVGLFADRVDISEEVVRLRSHLVQLEKVLREPETSGRKLDFLIQEMFREINTIGSKANDVEVSRYVVEIKTITERLREMVQNVE
jgi:uncharacterized protein (TIGR00255 family)